MTSRCLRSRRRAADASDSALDLPAPDGEEQSPPIEVVDSGIDLVEADLEQELVADALEAPPVESADSGIDLAAVHSLDSGIDLGSPHVVDSAGSGDLSGSAVVDSGLNLLNADSRENLPCVEPTTEPSSRPSSDSGLDLSSDEIAVTVGEDPGHPAGIEKNTPDASESGRDFIAEEVESGLDLPLHQFAVNPEKKAPDALAGQLPSEEEEVDLTEMSPPDVTDSSAVDLGASSAFPAAPAEPSAEPEMAEVPSPRPTQSKSIHGGEESSPSEVNLGGDRDERPKGEDYFEEVSGLGGSGVPLEMAATEPSGLHVDDEPTVGLDDQQPVDDEEEAAVEEEPAAPVKGKKEKRPSMVGAGLGGAVLGGLLATGACLALWFFHMEPPRGWRGETTNGQTATATNPSSIPNTPTPAAISIGDKEAAVRNGDLERAQKDNIEAADETKPAEMAARGEYRIRNYLAQQSANKKPIDAKDSALQAGVKDLEAAAKSGDKAVAADALFYLGVSREAAKDYEGALKVYKEGAEKFKNDAAQEERFDAGINRVTAKTGGATSRAEPADDGALLALLLTGLQPTVPAKPAPAEPAKPVAPANAPPPVGGEPAYTEAGSAFWVAVAKARAGKYDEAVAAIKEASQIHLKRRYSRLGKAQNPYSDPIEEIFLRSCEELKNYWELQKKLSTSGLPLVKGKDPSAAVDVVLAENKQLSEKVAKAATDAMTLQKAVEAAEKNTEEAKKETEKTKKDLKAAQKELTTTKGDLAAKTKDLTASMKSAVDLTEKLKTAEGTAAKASDELKNLAAALTPKFLKPEADEAALLAAVKSAVRLAAIADAQGAIRGLDSEVADLNSTLKQRWTPGQMLTFWMPLLQERGRNDLADKAVIDANRVLNDAKASPEDKARAHAVKGMALRNEEKYAAAKAELEQAQAKLPKADGLWSLETEAALKEVADPSAYFAARAEKYRKEKQLAEAVAMLNRALATAATPEAKARLIAERGAWRLEQALAHSNGRAAPNDPDLLAAEKDAAQAKKVGGARGVLLERPDRRTIGT